LQLEGVVVADCGTGEVSVCETLTVPPLPERQAAAFRNSCQKLQHQLELVTLQTWVKPLLDNNTL